MVHKHNTKKIAVTRLKNGDLKFKKSLLKKILELISCDTETKVTVKLRNENKTETTYVGLGNKKGTRKVQ